MAGSDSSQTTVVVHPLALVSVSDHVLRDNIGRTSATGAIGMLFGTREGGRVEVHRAIECFLKTGPPREIDAGFISNQIQLSCYIAKHGQLDRTDMSIYEQMQAHSASPVLLHWDLTPGDAQANRRLPVQVFSPKAGADDAMGGAEGGLQAAVMKIDASEPERIAIDYIGSARGSRGALVAEGSTVEQVLASDSTLQGLRASHAALGALAARVDVLISFATAVQSGAIPSSPSSRSILRSIASLLARLPVSGPGSQADKARALDVADSALVELAGRLVESIASLAVVSEKASTGVDSSSGAFGSGAGATDTHGAARGSKGTAARQAGGRWGDRGGVGPAHDTIGARGAAYSRRERLGAS